MNEKEDLPAAPDHSGPPTPVPPAAGGPPGTLVRLTGNETDAELADLAARLARHLGLPA